MRKSRVRLPTGSGTISNRYTFFISKQEKKG